MKNVTKFANAIYDAGGRAFLVGGLVRDMAMMSDEEQIEEHYQDNGYIKFKTDIAPGDVAAQDIDIEVYGLSWEYVKSVLEDFGAVEEVGKQFGVMKAMSLGWDVSLPRTESKSGEGHRGFDVTPDPNLSHHQAAKRRDLTINAISYDPLTEWFIDPLGAMSDIRNCVIRMADPVTFGDDPLRALRVASFASRFPTFRVCEDTMRMVGAQPIHELPAERIFTELKKILLGRKPSHGFDVLRKSGLLRYFPQINNLIGVPQDPGHHPEGCVYTHTMMVIDEATVYRKGDPDFDLPLMFGTLCHDFGKPKSTRSKDGKIHTRGHEESGVAPTREFMLAIKAPFDLARKVEVLVLDHLRPQLMANRARMKGYRRLKRRLDDARVSPELLSKVSAADVWGRGTELCERERKDKLREIFLDEMEKYTESASDNGITMKDAVTGKHLIAIGMEPGVEMGELLKMCRSVQDMIGMADDPGYILRYALRRIRWTRLLGILD